MTDPAVAAKRHQHRWVEKEWADPDGQSRVLSWWMVCSVCGVFKDPARSRRGRLSNERGKAYERSVAARLGVRRTGHHGGPDDAAGDWITVQVKVGGAFPELPWRWLSALPRDTLRAVVIGDAPGSSGKRREVIVLDFSEFVEWFGSRQEGT